MGNNYYQDDLLGSPDMNALCFVRGRVPFVDTDGNPQPQNPYDRFRQRAVVDAQDVGKDNGEVNMDRETLKQLIKLEADKGGYDFVVVDSFDERGDLCPDGSVPVCDRVPVASVIPGDPRWAWVCGDSPGGGREATFILFSSKEDEEAAEKFVANIKRCQA